MLPAQERTACLPKLNVHPSLKAKHMTRISGCVSHDQDGSHTGNRSGPGLDQHTHQHTHTRTHTHPHTHMHTHRHTHTHTHTHTHRPPPPLTSAARSQRSTE